MMIKRTFFDIEELIDTIFDSEYCKDYCIVGGFDTVRKALKEVIAIDNMMPFGIEINDPFWDGYDKEFIMSTYENDVFCEKAFMGERYVSMSHKITFVMPDCTDEFLSYIKADDGGCTLYYMVDFLCNNDCEKCEINNQDEADVDDETDTNGNDIKIRFMVNGVDSDVTDVIDAIRKFIGF